MATVPKLQLLRGLKANLPSEALAGQPLVTLDSTELFIGNGIGQPLLKISDIVVGSPNFLTSQVETKKFPSSSIGVVAAVEMNFSSSKASR